MHEPPGFDVITFSRGSAAGDVAVSRAADELRAAISAGDRVTAERAVAHMSGLVAALSPADPRTIEATAAADRALGELALFVGDAAIARSCFERVAAAGGRALRVEAMEQLAALARARGDRYAARSWSRRAAALVTNRAASSLPPRIHGEGSPPTTR